MRGYVGIKSLNFVSQSYECVFDNNEPISAVLDGDYITCDSFMVRSINDKFKFMHKY